MPEPILLLNDRPLPCPAGLTLTALLQREGVDAARVATAVNARFVPREARADTALQPGDVVITFEAIVGG
jgi:sulfur carrier protein